MTTATPEPVEVWLDSDGAQRYLHGTKSDLKPGDLIEAGRASNYGERRSAAFVYLTATLDAATRARLGSFLVTRGSGATIGIEDATGTTGRLVSLNTRDAIAEGDAFQFAP
ncbi:MAG: NAD(+)--rifampin ADP-ribosyltransferase [Deltaproteobacteria bacterium]|nr:NAD(+)--rifampin ADP-ribosyltransferase [Deltaproteobacteria bacterium]